MGWLTAIKCNFIAGQIKELLKLLNDAMLCIAQAIKRSFIAGQIKRKFKTFFQKHFVIEHFYKH